MQLHGFSPVPFERLLAGIRRQAAPLYSARKKVEPQFKAKLGQLAGQKFIVETSTQIVINTLKECVPFLQDLLGDAFLGLALGGSLLRGLGTIDSSDVDFFIYTQGGLAKQKECVDFVRGKLREKELKPCPYSDHFYDFQEINIFPPVMIVAAFCDFFLNEKVDIENLKQVALGLLERGKQMSWWHRLSPSDREKVFSDIYYTMMAADVVYVASKYYHNFVLKRPDLSQDELAYAKHPLFLEWMKKFARPFVEQRRQAFPFPPGLKAALIS